MDREKLIETGWQIVAREALPPNCHPIQLQEMRRAFYAGCQHLFGVLAAVGDDAVSEDRGVEILAAVGDELQQFSRDLIEGRA